MTKASPLIATLFLALGLVAPLAAALPSVDDLLPVQEPSVAGNYLAGREALADLNTAEAAQYFTDALDQDWDNPLLIENAFIALTADGQIERAASVAKRMLEAEPQHELARMVIAVVALKERRYTSAGRALDQIGRDTLIGVADIALRAWTYVGLNDLDLAFELLDQFEGFGLEDFLRFNRALMADVAGDEKQAARLMAEAYRDNPFVTRIVEAHIRTLADAGAFDAAKAVVEAFANEGLVSPSIDALREPLALGRRPGRFVTDVRGGAAELLLDFGAVILADGATDIGTAFLQLAHYLAPRNATVLITLADQYRLAGRLEAANVLYEAVPGNSPLQANAIVSLADSLADLDQPDEAIRRLRNIVTLHPDGLDAVSTLGDLLRAEERFEEAAEAYTRALAILGGDHPRDWRYYYVRGIAWERADQWEKAESDFLRALELNPERPEVLNYLGYSWVDQGLHLERALDMIARAVASRPDDGYIVDSLGWAYYRLDRIPEAVAELEKAVRLMPNDPEINDHLGDAYWRAGREREAKFQWTVAVDVDKTGRVAERSRAKLENGFDAAAAAAD